MLLKDAAGAFNGVVRGVIGRLVGQLYSQGEGIDKIGETSHELGTTRVILRAIVEI